MMRANADFLRTLRKAFEVKTMNRNELRDYCLSRRGASEDFPFGNDVAVFKVMGKMFALIPVKAPPQISLKCDPTWAEVLRQTYPAITAACHLNKSI